MNVQNAIKPTELIQVAKVEEIETLHIGSLDFDVCIDCPEVERCKIKELGECELLDEWNSFY